MPFTSSIGITELIIVLIIVLVIFGPSDCPGWASSLGAGHEGVQGLNQRQDKDDRTTRTTSRP